MEGAWLASQPFRQYISLASCRGGRIIYADIAFQSRNAFRHGQIVIVQYVDTRKHKAHRIYCFIAYKLLKVSSLHVHMITLNIWYRQACPCMELNHFLFQGWLNARKERRERLLAKPAQTRKRKENHLP